MKLISELPHAEKCSRPNAPHQPETQQLLSDLQSTHPNQSVSEDAMSSDEDAQELSLKDSDQAKNEEERAQTDDVMIAMRRKKRDELMHTAREQCRREMASVAWVEGQDLLSFAQNRSNSMMHGLVDLEGRKGDEPIPLYNHLKLDDRRHDRGKKKKKKQRDYTGGGQRNRTGSPATVGPNQPAQAQQAAPKPSGQKRKFAQTQDS
jgi:hypothetical protein